MSAESWYIYVYMVVLEQKLQWNADNGWHMCSICNLHVQFVQLVMSSEWLIMAQKIDEFIIMFAKHQPSNSCLLKIDCNEQDFLFCHNRVVSTWDIEYFFKFNFNFMHIYFHLYWSMQSCWFWVMKLQIDLWYMFECPIYFG